MKPKDFEVIYKFTVAPTVPFPSALNWNTEPIGELIRCKDCKWFGKAGCAVSIVDESDEPKENDYCSWAERKED